MREELIMGKIRTAVVGLNMGLQHAYAYHMAEKADLRWVVDLDEEKAAKVAEELGCNYTTDWTTILDDIDAVSIATPHHLHAEQSLTAINAGKHVLLEKPLANSEQESLQVIEAAEKKGVTFMIAYIVRYLPGMQRLKQAIETEEFGQPFNANCFIEAYLEPRPKDSWFSRIETLGGGVLFSHGCHYIDILLWLFGNPVKVAHLGTTKGTEWLEGEGTAHSTMLFENGTIAHLETSWGMKYARPAALLQVHTPEALLIYNGGKLEVVTAEGQKTLYEPSPSERRPGGNAIYEVNHFLECIEIGRKPLTDGREAMKSLRTIWTMYGSEGTPIQL